MFSAQFEKDLMFSRDSRQYKHSTCKIRVIRIYGAFKAQIGRRSTRWQRQRQEATGARRHGELKIYRKHIHCACTGSQRGSQARVQTAADNRHDRLCKMSILQARPLPMHVWRQRLSTACVLRRLHRNVSRHSALLLVQCADS